MTKPAEAPQRPLWLAAWALFLGIMVAYSFVLLSAGTPPLFVDYPDWVYQGVLFHGVLTGHPLAGYALKHYPVPNSTTTVGLGLLDCVLPWPWAAKLWIVFYLALACLATWTIQHTLRLREGSLLVAFPAIVFLNLNFWYGHISFEIGLCLLLVLLAMLVRDASLPLLTAMLVLIFFTHMEACAAALLLLAIWSAVTHHWQRLWAALPALILTVWYAAGRLASGDADVRGLPPPDYRYGSAGFLVYKINTFLKIFAYVNVSTTPGTTQSEPLLGRVLFVLLILACFVLATLCLVQIVRAATGLSAPPRSTNAPHMDLAVRTIGSFALLLAVASAVLPQIFLGVADPGSRLLLLAAAFGLLIVDWRGRVGQGIALLSVLFALVNLWQIARVERDPWMAASSRGLPIALLKYGHVEPTTRMEYYRHLRQGRMDEPIFPTGLFIAVEK